MIPRPEANKELEKLVSQNKKFKCAVSPNTTVEIVSTDASEVQQILEAIQPLEDVEVASHLRHNCWMPLLEAYSQEPQETKQWVIELLEMMDE